jgi:hypothetical protein
MTYNLSREVVDRWKVHLDAIASEDTTRFRTYQAQKLGYALREALAAAEHHGIEPYCLLVVKFFVSATELVVCHEGIKPDLPGPDWSRPVDHFGVIEAFNTIPHLLQPDPLIFENFVGDADVIFSWADDSLTVFHKPPTLTVWRSSSGPESD